MNEASLSARLDFSERRLALMEQRQMTRVWGARAVTVRQPVFPHGRLTHEETGPVTVESYAPATDGVGFPTTLTCIIHIPFSRLDGLPGARALWRLLWRRGVSMSRSPKWSHPPP